MQNRLLILRPLPEKFRLQYTTRRTAADRADWPQVLAGTYRPTASERYGFLLYSISNQPPPLL